MKLIFMGTPDFAVVSLNILQNSRHTVAAVVTATDKPAGRGRKLKASPVKQAAERHAIPVLQPQSIKDPQFIKQLKRYNADCFVVVAFRILPIEVFSIPPKGTFNLHASLLPKYRGAAPINWALIRGESKSGVTTFFIDQQIDTGEMLFQRQVSLHNDMTAGELARSAHAQRRGPGAGKP
ncbi:MAG: methionyl-tRNA formyltransferase [candidate division KSB1 bacterium]|nr:methionyl-tRNA formyltransferase [candidate division KSB1 bacterium]